MPEQPPSVPPPLSPETAANLRRLALLAAEHAYAPYSGFRVGAAILLGPPHAGTVVTGCNVENASFRLTTCAEQAAVVAAVAQFGPAIRLAAVAVANLNHAASMPCGACRQTLLEFTEEPSRLPVLFPLQSADSFITEGSSTLADLLPAAFSLQPSPR